MSEPNSIATSQQSSPLGRAKLILAFGLASFLGVIFRIVFSGLFDEPWIEHQTLYVRTYLIITLCAIVLGIAASIMGFRDLKKIRKGLIEPQGKKSRKAGAILGIIGPILSLFVLVAFSNEPLLSSYEVAIIVNMEDIAVHAHEYRIRPPTSGGGNGSYLGYVLPNEFKRKHGSDFEIQAISSDSILVVGNSAYVGGSIKVSIDSAGKLSNWKYTGVFQWFTPRTDD